MSRLTDKSFTARAPQTAGSVPELPDFNPQLAEIPGGTETNAALQRWWDQVRQRIEFTNGSTDSRFSRFSKTIDGITGSITILQEITSDMEDYLEARYTINVTAGPVVTGMTLFSATGPDTEISYVAFQADRFLINTSTGGNKALFSASASAVKLGDVLTVDLVNQKVFIGTGTWANNNTAFYVDDDGNFSLKSYLTFNATTNTLSIATTAGSTGGWTINPTTLTGGNAILDSSGVLILGTANDIVYVSAVDATYRLWVGNATAGVATFRVTKGGAVTATSGVIGGWTLSSTTLSANNAVLDSTGQLLLGTANDIVILSATDTTYRIWIGNVTAGSAAFRVTKAGVMTATGGIFSGEVTATTGAIGGFTIGPTALTAASGSDSIELNSGGGGFLSFESTGSSVSMFAIEGVTVQNAGGNFAFELRSDPGSATYGILNLYNGSGGATIQCDGSSGDITATNFIGGGGGLTALNASSISSGTLGNARLPTTVQLGDGSAGAPTFSYTNDTDTGWFLDGVGKNGCTVGGTTRFTVSTTVIACLLPLKLNHANTVAAAAQVGYLTLQDSTGASIKILTG